MRSPNQQIRCYLDPKFDAVIDFEIYDGFESGLAVFATGEGIRFSSVGDSKSRLRRAFEMELLEGSWWGPAVELRRKLELSRLESGVVFEPLAEFSDFKSRVSRAVTREQIVAVGTPYLLQLAGVLVGDEEIADLRKLGWSDAAYRYVCNLVKSRKNLVDFRLEGRRSAL